MKPRVLFVEDHQALLKNLSEFFTEDRYEADFASNGLTALHLLSGDTFDAVVLDVMLPGINGFDICRKIRSELKSNVPVLLLTALDAIENKVDGFGVGADDYLCKPFDMRELELRINSLCSRKNLTSDEVKVNDLIFNPGSLSITYKNKKTFLTGLSATLFDALIHAHPNYLSYKNISERLWGAADQGDEKTIRTHVYTLRKTLKQHFGKKMIRGIYGRGYQLDTEEE